MNPDKTFASISLPPSSSRPNDLRGIDRALDNIYSIFGTDAVLLPVPANKVEGMSMACPVITLEQTREVAYQVRLTRECIAVALGNGLFAIFFATDAAREEFLQANPLGRDSLMTSGPQGVVLWLRCLDAVIGKPLVPGLMCWLGAGEAIVVAGRGALEPQFTIQNLAKPAALPYNTIVWPEPMRIEVILHGNNQAHGSPFTKDPRNWTIPNWDYWARCFGLINHVRFDTTRESFFHLPPGQEIQLLPNERVLCMISEFLSNFGRQERFAILLQYRQHRYLKEFMAMLKIVMEQARDPEDNLEKFVATALEPCHGADVSSSELTAAHSQYFRSRNLPPYPTPIFEKRVPAYIDRLFRGARSRKIQRGGKYCRGFKHIRIKRPRGN